MISDFLSIFFILTSFIPVSSILLITFFILLIIFSILLIILNIFKEDSNKSIFLYLSIKLNIRIEGIIESVSIFYNKRDKYKDLIKYLETIIFIIEEKYRDFKKIVIIKRLIFRLRIREVAYA